MTDLHDSNAFEGQTRFTALKWMVTQSPGHMLSPLVVNHAIEELEDHGFMRGSHAIAIDAGDSRYIGVPVETYWHFVKVYTKASLERQQTATLLAWIGFHYIFPPVTAAAPEKSLWRFN
ncbi:hypothetical protein ANO11243_067900 [Dothideomycetidae sp. 11243]|nr:hypothetical protein ANO11243_067900 [fungal sp. No.11243]